ncbi:UPF0182 family protein [Nocardioides sp. B-3]|nr:UPF0182 family protein [Nocardioides sp. B-3]
MRAYYSVSKVLDVDRYEIDGTDRAMVPGVRELDRAGLADSDKNWANLHTVYTHGNGVIAAYANQRPGDDDEQSGTIEWAEGRGDRRECVDQPDGRGLRVARLLRGRPARTTRSWASEKARTRSSSTCPRVSGTTRTRPRPTTDRAACRSTTSSTSCSTR